MKKKRIMSLLMVLFLSAGFVQTPVQAEAAVVQTESITITDEDRYNPEYYEEPEIIYPSAKKSMSRAVRAQQTLEEYVVSAIENFQTEIDISAYNIPRSKVGEEYQKILNNHPEIFYVGNGFRYSYNPQDVVVNITEISYLDTPDKIRLMRDELEAAAEQAVAQVDTSLDDYEQALIVHDYLVQNCEYDFENYEKNQVPDISHTAYGALVNHIAVCDGYSDAFSYIMENKLGVSCDVVSSDAMAHAWNMIEIGGKWYHVDATWDDPTKDNIGRVGHNYFLLSDGKISDSSHKHNSWNDLHPADSTSYDDAFWAADSSIYDGALEAGVSSAICYNNGSWYYSKYQEDENDVTLQQAVKLVKKNELLGGSEEPVFATSVWSIGNSYYSGSYMYLAKADGKVYFNTSTDIRQIMEDGSVKTIYMPKDLSGNLVYGFTIRGNELWYAPQSKPSYEGYQQDIHKYTLQTVTGISAADVTETYTGQPVTITVEGLQAGDVVQYADADGTYRSVQPEMIDAGTYEVSYKVERDGYLSFYGKASVTIGQANPDYEIPLGLTASSGNKLADVQLPQGFTWQEPDTLLREVGSHTYSADYTPADTKNYRTVSVRITVKVTCPGHQYTYEVTKEPNGSEKGEATYTCIFCGHSYTEEIDDMPQEITGITAANVTGIYNGQAYAIEIAGTQQGDVLQYALKDGTNLEYRMVQPEMVNAGTYEVWYKVMRAGYQTFTGSVKVEITRARPQYTVPQNLKGSSGTTLASIKLPKGFLWQTDQAVKLSKEGYNKFYVIYIPEDQTNYEQITDIEVSVEVRCPGHQYNYVVTKQPTETQKGLKTYTCKLCGKIYTEDIAMISPARPAKVSGLKVTKQSDKSLSFSWKKASGVSYRLMFYQGGKVISTKYITGNSCIYNKLKPGTIYTLRVTPYRTVNGQKVYATSTGAAKTATAPAKAKLSKAKRSGKSKVKLTWKKVSGASGYEIFMKTGNGKYKKVKIVGNAKTLSFTKSGLSKKKSYSFRIRAYTKVDKAKVYGAYSNVKKVK